MARDENYLESGHVIIGDVFGNLHIIDVNKKVKFQKFNINAKRISFLDCKLIHFKDEH